MASYNELIGRSPSSPEAGRNIGRAIALALGGRRRVIVVNARSNRAEADQPSPREIDGRGRQGPGQHRATWPMPPRCRRWPDAAVKAFPAASTFSSTMPHFGGKNPSPR